MASAKLSLPPISLNASYLTIPTFLYTESNSSLIAFICLVCLAFDALILSISPNLVVIISSSDLPSLPLVSSEILPLSFFIFTILTIYSTTSAITNTVRPSIIYNVATLNKPKKSSMFIAPVCVFCIFFYPPVVYLLL